MRYYLITIAIFQLAVVVAPYAAIARDAVVVYESLRNPAGGGHEFRQDKPEMGQSISLQGPERRITQIDLLLSSLNPEEYRVRFYEVNNLTGAPSKLIWESPIQESNFGNHILSVMVPNVEVPQTMAYTVRPLFPDSSRMAVRTGTNEASIGVHESYWYRWYGAVWRDDLFTNGTLGARVFAIPEPATIAQFGVLVLLVGVRRRGRQ